MRSLGRGSLKAHTRNPPYQGARLQPCHPSRKRKAASAAEGIAALILCTLLTACRPHDFPQYPANYREFAYVTNGGSNTVTVLDLVNLRRDREIAVGDNPTGVAISLTRNEVYVVNSGGGNSTGSGNGSVSVIDAQTNAVAATIPVRKKPYFIDVSQDGHRAYVANSGSNNVSVIDLYTRKTVATIGVGEAPGVARISPDNQTLVVTNRVGGSVTVIDGATLKVRSVFPRCPGATDAVILPDSSKAFVACSAGHQVMVLALARKPTANSSVTELEKSDHLLDLLDVGQSPVNLAMKPDGGEIFVSNFDSNTISEIATGTNEVGGASLIGDHPARGIVSADNSTLWVSNFTANTVGVYSIDDGQRINAIQVGDGPDALAFSSAGNLVLVANARSGDVAVIRTTSYSPQGTRKIGALFTMLPAAKHPNAIAVKAFLMP
jgi:YVTN family beta-propeller protein